MILIALEGMRFTARHGFYEEENELGTEFIIDVWVEVYTPKDKGKDKEDDIDDDITRTVNYETIFLICQSEMKKTAKLIETVAQRLLKRINEHFEEHKKYNENFPGVAGVRIRLRKMHPPLGGQVHSAYVETASGSFGWPSLRTLRKLKELIEGWHELRRKFENL